MQGPITVLVSALVAIPFAVAANKCAVTGLQLVLPANQSAVQPPSSAPLAAVTLGVGTQNYTCQGLKWVTVGALASLFDISCLMSTPAEVTALQTQSNAVIVSALAGLKVADHYYDTSVGTLSPVFNFAVSNGGYAVGKKVGDASAPAKTDVEWLLLQNVRGTAAMCIVREHTAGGEPPQSNCPAEGQSLQVSYSARYWFYQ